MIDPEKYTFVIRKTNEDEEEPFVARVIEFPYLSGYGKTPEEAYGIVVDAIKTLSEAKASLPNPLPEINEFSGRISLRIPKSLHRKLANFAEIEGVSINQFLGNLLSWASENYYKKLPETNTNFVIPNFQGHFVSIPGKPYPNALLDRLRTVSYGEGLNQNIANEWALSQKSEAQILEDKEKRPLVEI